MIDTRTVFEKVSARFFWILTRRNPQLAFMAKSSNSELKKPQNAQMTMGELAEALNKLPDTWKEMPRGYVSFFEWGGTITLSMLNVDTIQYVNGKWMRTHEPRFA
jgi:hypothetical protein